MIVEIVLVNTGRVTVVSECDAYWALSSEWFESINGYAQCHRYGYLHRAIVRPDAGMVVDHINQRKLDNRRENLRQLTHAVNLTNNRIRPNNTTGYKSVYRYKSKYGRSGRWLAQPTLAGKSIHLGVFDTAEEANEACRKWREENGRFDAV